MAVSESDVLAIMDTDITASDVTPYLTTAQNFFSDRLGSENISSAMEDEITKYLAAHFASIKDRRAQRVAVGATRETYAELGQGLMATDYGQYAVSLDPSDILRRLSGGSFRYSSKGR